MGKQAPNSIVTCGSFPAASPDSVLSPLERDPRSPKGWRKRASDGVGLGIVVALERSSSSSASDVPAKIVANSHLPQYYHHHHHHHHHQRPTSPPSTPPVPAARHLQRRWSIWDEEEEQEAAGPATFFCGSPPPRIPIDSDSVGPAPGFLKYCQLCRKNLDGEDIYMYRGEKAFCSAECRSRQIAADEYHQEPRSYYNMAPTRTSQAAAAPVSGVPDRTRLFYTGIMAA